MTRSCSWINCRSRCQWGSTYPKAARLAARLSCTTTCRSSCCPWLQQQTCAARQGCHSRYACVYLCAHRMQCKQLPAVERKQWLPQTCSSSQTAIVGQATKLVKLLTLLLSTSFFDVSEQVALKACQQLPPSLQHCMLLALAQAVDAQLSPLTAQDSTTSSQSTLVPAPLAALCLQHLASSLRFDISCIESCVSVLADASEQAAQQAILCLLLTALCRGRETELAASTITQLAAAAHTMAQCLQQHAIQVLSCDPPSCSRSSTTSSCSSSSSSSQGAAPADPSHSGSVNSADDLQLGVLRLQQWCIESAALSGG